MLLTTVFANIIFCTLCELAISCCPSHSELHVRAYYAIFYRALVTIKFPYVKGSLMMEEPPEQKLCRISRQHLDILVQYMERYPRLALATARNRDAHIESRHMWEKVARTLNKLEDNVTKTGRGWSRVCRTS